MYFSLFSIPISITSKSQALAEVGHWLRQWKMEVGSGKLDSEVRNEKSHISLHSGATPASHINHHISGFPKLITTPNPEMIVAARSDPEFLKALQSADLAIPDGIGVVWAVKSLSLRGLRRGGGRGNLYKSDSHAPITSGLGMTDIQISNFHRLSGLDFMEALIQESAKNGWKVMLLGGKPGIAETVAEKLMHQIRPGLALQGQAFIKSISGPENISYISKSENDRLISAINSFSPDLLFVAFGHGKQEKWLNVNRDRLKAGVAMGVGGAFDQIADPSLRPPAIINSIGLGWLYRLFREPWRWRRQLALIRFAGMVARTLIDPSTLRQLADRSG